MSYLDVSSEEPDDLPEARCRRHSGFAGPGSRAGAGPRPPPPSPLPAPSPSSLPPSPPRPPVLAPLPDQLSAQLRPGSPAGVVLLLRRPIDGSLRPERGRLSWSGPPQAPLQLSGRVARG